MGKVFGMRENRFERVKHHCILALSAATSVCHTRAGVPKILRATAILILISSTNLYAFRCPDVTLVSFTLQALQSTVTSDLRYTRDDINAVWLTEQVASIYRLSQTATSKLRSQQYDCHN